SDDSGGLSISSKPKKAAILMRLEALGSPVVSGITNSFFFIRRPLRLLMPVVRHAKHYYPDNKYLLNTRARLFCFNGTEYPAADSIIRCPEKGPALQRNCSFRRAFPGL